MPVVLRKDAQDDWIDPELQDAAKVAAIIRTGAIDEVTHHPMRLLINKPKTEGPELIEPLAASEGE